MRKPNFLVIGAQKSGTTWLHRFFSGHPDIYMPEKPKELMYFDVERNFRKRTLDDYLAHFEPATLETAIGEATPGYLWCSPEHSQWGGVSEFRTRIPMRVQEALGPNIKLVAVLRNPIDRALSAFLHHRKKGRIQPDASIRCHLDRSGIIHMGFYGAHLARWAEVFSKKNFIVRTYESLFSDPATLDSIQAFLGVKPRPAGELSSQRIHKGFGFKRSEQGAADSEGRRIATAEDIDILKKAFAPDTKRLAREWDIDLEPWMLEPGADDRISKAGS